jgi:cruciform cutting endonuclease 1
MKLSALRGKLLQHIAFLTGATSTGTKPQLSEQLHGTLNHARMPSGGTRILSVDMGIRNLAYCVIDVPAHRQATDTNMRVQSWKRLDLLEKMRPAVDTCMLPSEPASGNAESTKIVFTPSVMSKAALRVAQDFLAHKPDIILIERQRFRTGGGSAIQEWTVRVNTLESMLWACFETLKHSRHKLREDAFPAVHEVAPQRVAKFWAAPVEAQFPSAKLFTGSFSPPEPKVRSSTTKAAGAGKKEKIAVLRSWIDGDGGVSLDFTPGTQVTAGAFATATGSKRRKSKDCEIIDTDVTLDPKKLDDLADCVLQGVAWVRWEENRRAILEAFEGDVTAG